MICTYDASHVSVNASALLLGHVIHQHQIMSFKCLETIWLTIERTIIRAAFTYLQKRSLEDRMIPGVDKLLSLPSQLKIDKAG